MAAKARQGRKDRARIREWDNSSSLKARRNGRGVPKFPWQLPSTEFPVQNFLDFAGRRSAEFAGIRLFEELFDSKVSML